MVTESAPSRLAARPCSLSIALFPVTPLSATKPAATALPLPRALRALGWRAWLPTLVLLPVCLYEAVSRGEPGLLDGLNLLIHEAGHLCFYFLGETMHAAGGTLMQLILPAAIAVHFWQYRSVLGMQVGLLWLGENCLDVSVYVADARVQELLLLPGRQHDWHFLLDAFGLLAYDQTIAYFFCVAAVLTFMVLLALPALVDER